ncbi:MAG: hypothetical protein CMP11_08465 [Zetaproteobacteria bacterium]|nr:hypothetical protein [Pseudobdellovibrionaceae bacterium]|tara:strand:- start:4690 stop:5664 length:975 start_codon:yes stop_codon:yes gene_type:complete
MKKIKRLIKKNPLKSTSLLFLLAPIFYFFVKQQTYPPHERVAEINVQLERSEKLRFFVLGDTGTGDKNQLKVSEWMERRCEKIKKLDGILMLGDNFYNSGVDSVDDLQWQNKIVVPYGRKCLSQAKIYPTLGNHDYKKNPGAQISYTAMSQNWFMPNRYYSLNYPSLLKIIAFDSIFPDICFTKNGCSVNFLLSQIFSNNKLPWTFILSHYPLSSASKKRGNYSGKTFIAKTLKKILCSKPLIWFSGHSHHLEHRKIKDCKIEMITSGAGGGHLSLIDQNQKESIFVKSSHGFIEVEVDKNELKMKFFSESLEPIYEKIITNKK